MNKWLYIGQVYHQRFFPKKHELTNNVFYLFFPLSQVNQLENKIFSVNRPNLLSFYFKDHGDRTGSDLWAWALAKLKENGIEKNVTEIKLQTFPRIFGFVFNPVSFWFCYSGSEIIATIAEVNNTFGETSTYVMKPSELEKQKTFHVSPFFQVEGKYDFSFLDTEKKQQSTINYYKNGQRLLVASIAGVPKEWNFKNVFLAWLAHPLLTFAIVFYIHFNALILFLKRVPFFGKNGTEGSV